MSVTWKAEVNLRDIISKETDRTAREINKLLNKLAITLYNALIKDQKCAECNRGCAIFEGEYDPSDKDRDFFYCYDCWTTYCMLYCPSHAIADDHFIYIQIKSKRQQFM